MADAYDSGGDVDAEWVQQPRSAIAVATLNVPILFSTLADFEAPTPPDVSDLMEGGRFKVGIVAHLEITDEREGETTDSSTPIGNYTNDADGLHRSIERSFAFLGEQERYVETRIVAFEVRVDKASKTALGNRLNKALGR